MRYTQIQLAVLFMVCFYSSFSQSILPPVTKWKGKSQSLVVKDKHPWVTPFELSGLTGTPSYEETMSWLSMLVEASESLKMVPIGVSAQHRTIYMVIASSDQDFTPEELTASSKPKLLVQAGIHAGEIDGKDAGMMLLRDIAFENKSNLIDQVNFLFIPILNVDGHERVSEYGRVNQRGPKSMGWRTNALNLNLNRDYSKLETEGVQAVVKVMNQYDPDLYIDLHVTDGADYQYDITYGWSGEQGYSPATTLWMEESLKPEVNAALKKNGHIPGPLMFAFNDEDFSEGNAEFEFSPRFSETYGNSRQLPSILVENHSLKPYHQRVLGTYVFLEQVLKTLAQKGQKLSQAISKDRMIRLDSVVVSYGLNESLADSMHLLGIQGVKVKSEITGQEYIQWTGQTIEEDIVIRTMDKPLSKVSMPKAYWIPVQWDEVIEKLKLHGIEVETIPQERTIEIERYKIESYQPAAHSYEGRVRVENIQVSTEKKQVIYPSGSVRVTTDQPKGALVALLLEPQSTDSFLQWGYFHSIFSRTEYIEKYVLEPMAKKMLEENPALQENFEQLMKTDTAFANSPNQIYRWFYAQTPYFDQQWKIYPIGRE